MRLKNVTRDELVVRRVRHGRGHAYLDAEGKPWPRANCATGRCIWAFRRRGPMCASRPIRDAHPGVRRRCGGASAVHLSSGLGSAADAPQEAEAARDADDGAAAHSAAGATTTSTPRPAAKTLALAIGVALIDRTAMRIGRERYLDARGTRGAGTLFTRDVAVKGDEITLKFPAKSGKVASYTLSDARLAAAIARVKTIPGKRLLMYRDDDGAAQAIRTEELNRYLREIAGAKVTAKDFRTLHASALAARRWRSWSRAQSLRRASGRWRG